MHRLSFFVPVALAVMLSWHAGQRSFSFDAPTITTALGWESSTITGLIWYPVSASLPEQPQSIGPADNPYFNAGTVAVGAPLIDKPPRFPLILVSHGNGGSAAQMAWLGACRRHKPPSRARRPSLPTATARRSDATGRMKGLSRPNTGPWGAFGCEGWVRPSRRLLFARGCGVRGQSSTARWIRTG